jgi:hypothetical protein
MLGATDVGLVERVIGKHARHRRAQPPERRPPGALMRRVFANIVRLAQVLAVGGDENERHAAIPNGAGKRFICRIN